METIELTPIMSLSAAIREGAALLPEKAIGKYFGYAHAGENWRDNPVSCCALGAALVANKANFTKMGVTRTLETLYPEVELELPGEMFPPEIVGDTVMLFIAIRELNDTYGWTREAIADWLYNIGL